MDGLGLLSTGLALDRFTLNDLDGVGLIISRDMITSNLEF